MMNVIDINVITDHHMCISSREWPMDGTDCVIFVEFFYLMITIVSDSDILFDSFYFKKK